MSVGMSWLPFNLQAPPVMPGDSPEAYAQTVLHRFLKRHFTGAAVAVWVSDEEPSVPKTFPRCDFAYQLEPLEGNGPWIHSSMTSLRREECGEGDGNKWVEHAMTWSLVVRVAADGNNGADDDYAASGIAENVAWLLSSGNKAAMSQLGVGRVRVAGGPIALTVPGFKARQIIVTMRVFGVGFERKG